LAQWAYEQTENSNGLTWVRGDELVRLTPKWRTSFGSGPERAAAGKREAAIFQAATEH
jgi:hypothetical protein